MLSQNERLFVAASIQHGDSPTHELNKRLYAVAGDKVCAYCDQPVTDADLAEVCHVRESQQMVNTAVFNKARGGMKL